MFKWCCLAVAVVFLSVVVWVLNEVRCEVRRSSQIVHTSGQTVNEHLPAIVERTRKVSETVVENLPEMVEKARVTTETLAELSADIRQLKELAGISSKARDQGLIAYADSVLDYLDASGGVIGLKKQLGGKGLKNSQPAREWVAATRKEAVVQVALAGSKKDLLTRLANNKFGSPWYLQEEGKEPVTVLDWLKANHPATRGLPSK